ncbi:MAG: YceI family protein [Acidimicrobiia bacterium]|nr:YceI family protein [Acidimicrobiia bacterium]
MVRYEIVSDSSEIQLDASSSVHPIHTSTRGLTGFVELDDTDGVFSLSESPAGSSPGELHVPLGELRSGNPLIDRETRRRLDTKSHPEISGMLTSLSHVEGDRYAATGSVDLMGESVDVEGELTISYGEAADAGDDTLRIEGEQVFDVRDWGIKPPKLLVVKVHPDVTVRISLLLRP